MVYPSDLHRGQFQLFCVVRTTIQGTSLTYFCFVIVTCKETFVQ